jgi:hypothetical protein
MALVRMWDEAQAMIDEGLQRVKEAATCRAIVKSTARARARATARARARATARASQSHSQSD